MDSHLSARTEHPQSRNCDKTGLTWGDIV